MSLRPGEYDPGRRLPPNPWLTLSLLIATLLVAWPQPRDGGLAFFVLAATTLLSARFRLGWVALLVLFLVGIELRFVQYGIGTSDVNEVVGAGLNEILHGLNPYAPAADVTRAPFPYGLLAVLWYLPLHDPQAQEFGLSIALLAVLALRGQPLGLAVWATATFLVNLASDGSNDHSAALFLLVALVVLERMPRAGALLLGLSAGFKIYALAWLPPIFIWAGAAAFAAGVLGAIAIWLPAAIIWGPGNILSTFQAAEAVHTSPYYSLGQALATAHVSVARRTLDLFRLAAGALTAVLVSPLARTHRGVVVAGMAIYFVTLYAGFWSTSAYLVPPALLACWYVDLWLGPIGTRVAWPADPVGRLIAWVDARWPTVVARRAETIVASRIATP